MKTDFTNFNKCPIDSHVQHPFVSNKRMLEMRVYREFTEMCEISFHDGLLFTTPVMLFTTIHVILFTTTHYLHYLS